MSLRTGVDIFVYMNSNDIRNILISHPSVGELRTLLTSLGYEVKVKVGHKTRLLTVSECSNMLLDLI